jgi:hypothetical protein
MREPVMDINNKKATNRIIYKYNGFYMRRSPAAAAAGICAMKLTEKCH